MAACETSRTSLLGMPLEIRRHILSYLVAPDTVDDLDARKPSYYASEFHEHEEQRAAQKDDQNILRFRNSRLTPSMKLRQTYKVRSGRLRSACEDASYACKDAPGLDMAVMRVCSQLHCEAAELLYACHTFDFDTHVEACVPFLADLTPYSRSRVRRIGIVKRALPYEKEFDRCEWAGMCKYLSSQLSLWHLALGVVAGKPALGWENVRTFAKQDFDMVLSTREEMAWVNELASIKGLRSVDVRACIEHSPPPCSNALAFFVTFSASVEPSFAEYLSSRLIAQAA